MTNELLFSHLFIMGVIGLISSSISFLVIKALTKNTTVAGILSIILGLVLSIIFFLNTYFGLSHQNYSQYFAAKINQSFFNNLTFYFMWLIGTIIFWVSTKKHENTKTKKSKK